MFIVLYEDYLDWDVYFYCVESVGVIVDVGDFLFVELDDYVVFLEFCFFGWFVGYDVVE